MTEGPPINLDYRTPDPRTARSAGPAYLISRLISSYIGYVLVMVVLALIVPRFEQVFKNFKLELPAATRLLVDASRACLACYLWALFVPLPGMWAYANYCIPNALLRRRLRLAAFLFVVAFLIATILALFLPMISLMEGVSSKH